MLRACAGTVARCANAAAAAAAAAALDHTHAHAQHAAARRCACMHRFPCKDLHAQFLLPTAHAGSPHGGAP